MDFKKKGFIDRPLRNESTIKQQTGFDDISQDDEKYRIQNTHY